MVAVRTVALPQCNSCGMHAPVEDLPDGLCGWCRALMRQCGACGGWAHERQLWHLPFRPGAGFWPDKAERWLCDRCFNRGGRA